METYYVLFGSNQGDRQQLFAQASLLVEDRCGRIVQVSKAYESEPWGFEAEEWFLNRVIAVESELAPEEMLRQLQAIESELGRVRHPEIEGYTSRTADLDVLYYGNHIIQTESLTIPHPRLHLRRFALAPMCDVAPYWMHPVLHKTQVELLECCPDESVVREF